MNIADKIKKARQSANLTQQEVSDKLNVSRKTLSSWENNRSNPDLKMLKSLADVFDEDLSYFLEIERKNVIPKKLIWLYWINSVLFSINLITTMFTKINIYGFTVVELLVVILLFAVGNQQESKLKIKFKWLILLFVFSIFSIFTLCHSFDIFGFFSIGSVIGSLSRAIIMTWSFYCIVKFSKII
ncbi:helix-turn-helix domain-containing protein [Fructilactobacillus frigidiflavus]|uniref:helix-turn-helix domain-containing protein n=1 Tax=Fructilactobacillus frigidiflavus TaxID=3242688 RepID=UPI0037570571